MNSSSGYYDLLYRNYDAAIGRFLQVDPLAHLDHSVSPYAYAGNNPVMFNDPFGDKKKDKKKKERKEKSAKKNHWSSDDKGVAYYIPDERGGGGTVYLTQNGRTVVYRYNGDGSFSHEGNMATVYLPEVEISAQQDGYAHADPGIGESEREFPYNSAGLAFNIAGSGFSVLKSEYRPLLREFTKTAIKAKALTGKVLGAAGFALTAYQFESKLADPNQHLDVNDYMDFGFGVGTFAAGLMVVNPVGLAVVIGVGVGIYTLWRDNGE